LRQYENSPHLAHTDAEIEPAAGEEIDRRRLRLLFAAPGGNVT